MTSDASGPTNADDGGDVGGDAVANGDGDDASMAPAVPPLIRSALFSRWQEPPTSMMTIRRVELRRLADSMRIIIERLVATAAPTEKLIEAADELARVALTFDEFKVGAEYEGFSEAANAGNDPHASFEHSPFIGRANPLAPPMRLQEIESKVHGRVVFGSAYEGPPGCVHGGYVAAAFDELLGATQSLSGQPGMTGTLTIKYRSPTPLHAELHLVGELTGVEGRKIFTKGLLFANNGDGTEQLCAEAEGIFVTIDFSKFVQLKEERDEREQVRLSPPV